MITVKQTVQTLLLRHAEHFDKFSIKYTFKIKSTGQSNDKQTWTVTSIISSEKIDRKHVNSQIWAWNGTSITINEFEIHFLQVRHLKSI